MCDYVKYCICAGILIYLRTVIITERCQHVHVLQYCYQGLFSPAESNLLGGAHFIAYLKYQGSVWIINGVNTVHTTPHVMEIHFISFSKNACRTVNVKMMSPHVFISVTSVF